MGTKRCLASCKEANRTIGPSAPPIMAIEADSFASKPMDIAIGKVKIEPISAGIARSGAYNRTLTPFGFQSEERTYWEAPEVYYNMSPFMHADKMKTPLLLIHGEADNNSGTYPMQSKRYFNALKGLGATVRLVMFPKESHGYRAKETILHLLWEQDQWLEKYLKN